MVKKYVITGGSYTGKSELVHGLNHEGYYGLGDVADFLIDQELARKGDCFPWTDRRRFQERVLQTQLLWESEIPGPKARTSPVFSETDVVFLDRGVPDGIAFYRAEGLPVPTALLQAARSSRYDGVFILDYLNNFKQKPKRTDSLQDSQKIHRELHKVYDELGYTLVHIPNEPTSCRVNRVLCHLGLRKLLSISPQESDSVGLLRISIA